MKQYRPLKLEDLDQIIIIENQSFDEPWSLDGFRDLLANMSFGSLGHFDGKKLVGYVVYYIVLNELHVINVAVDPHYRKRQFGFELLSQVHEIGKKKGATFVYLEVRQTNEAAQKLYEKLGYRKQGRRIGYYSNREDALLMYKELE